jgi:transposase InsO family protein
LENESKRSLKTLSIVDDFSKKCPGLLVDYSITSKNVTDFFETLANLPKKLRCDNGTEMTSLHFLDWARRNNISIQYIEPGKPIQNAYIESFNGRIRDDFLNEEETRPPLNGNSVHVRSGGGAASHELNRACSELPAPI